MIPINCLNYLKQSFNEYLELTIGWVIHSIQIKLLIQEGDVNTKGQKDEPVVLNGYYPAK
ncbi:MAG: hypothetical protein V4511_12000 [Bacteroidota bacterium]